MAAEEVKLEELVVVDECILTEFAGWRALSDRPSFPVEGIVRNVYGDITKPYLDPSKTYEANGIQAGDTVYVFAEVVP